MILKIYQFIIQKLNYLNNNNRRRHLLQNINDEITWIAAAMMIKDPFLSFQQTHQLHPGIAVTNRFSN